MEAPVYRTDRAHASFFQPNSRHPYYGSFSTFYLKQSVGYLRVAGYHWSPLSIGTTLRLPWSRTVTAINLSTRLSISTLERGGTGSAMTFLFNDET